MICDIQILNIEILQITELYGYSYGYDTVLYCISTVLYDTGIVL